MTGAAAVDLAARLCLVCMFPFSAVDKIWHWANSVAQTRSARLPGGAALKADAVISGMLVAAILVEGLTPLFIVAGLWDRPAAALLAGFCVVTGFLYHPFWTWPDFFSARDDSVARGHFWEFVKNLGLVGGLLLVVFAGSLAAPGPAARPGDWSTRYLARPHGG
jgi:putative oxidoreductase